MKTIYNFINKLKNPDLFYKESKTNFLNEIYNGKETKRVTPEYLNQFSKHRLASDRSQRHTDTFLTLVTLAFLTIIALLILLAIKH